MAKGLDEEIAGLMSAEGLIGGTEPKLLAAEIRFYKSNLGTGKDEEGRHILVFGLQHYGFYETRDDALRERFRRFGQVAFLAKQVIQNEKPRPLGLTIF